MQPTETVWTILVGDYRGTIPVKFGQIHISGSREEVILSSPCINQCKIVTPLGRVNFDPRGKIWTTLVEDLLMMLYTKYESFGSCSYRKEDIWKLHLKPKFLPRDLLRKPIRTISTILLGDHPGIIPVKFGEIHINGSREKVI